jgi:hypothetical protein
MAHRYWRIYITATRYTDSWFATLAEVELRGTVGGSDLATGGTAAASSEDTGGGGRYASNAFDNSASTLWVSLSGVAGPAWISYDLGTAQNVAQVLLQAGDTSTRAERAPRTFDIQYSDNGSSWTTASSVVDEAAWSAGESRTFNLPADDPTISLSVTEANDTASAAAVAALSASLSKTEANDTASASALAALSATLSRTDGDDSISATIESGSGPSTAPFTFDGATKIITVDTGVTSFTAAELWSRWVDWQSANAGWPLAFRQVGGDALGGGLFIPPYFFLLNGWRVRPYEGNHTLIIDGNLFVEGGGVPVVQTIGSFNVSVQYTVPVQAQGISTSGSSGPSASEIADAVLAAINAATIPVNVKQVNDVVIAGAGVAGSNPWRPA